MCLPNIHKRTGSVSVRMELFTFLVLYSLFIGMSAGQCPSPDSYGVYCITYHDTCQSDKDCQYTDEDYRCCLVQGCGKTCINLREKPGICPPFDFVPQDECEAGPEYIHGCFDDAHCSGDLKCCKSSCGVRGCMTPLMNRPQCPAIHNNQCTDPCSSDNDCKLGFVCCYNPSCGRSCRRRVKTSYGR